METQEYLKIIERRDQLRKTYLDAKRARDDARAQAALSLSEHRSRLLEITSIRLNADRLKSSIKIELQVARNKLRDVQREFHETQSRCQQAQAKIVEQLSQAKETKIDSLDRHHAALSVREEAERACAEAWRAYREVDGSIPEARLQVLGLDGVRDKILETTHP